MRAAPRTSECGLVDVELGFPETPSADSAGRVGRLLENRLGRGKVIDQAPEGSIFAGGELVNERLEHERRVARPCVQVVRVRRAWASNDNAGLSGNIRT